MGKIDISKFKKTSNGLIPVDNKDNSISMRTLLQSGSLDYNSKTSKINLVNTSSGKYSYFSGSKLDLVVDKKQKKKDKDIKVSVVKKKSSIGKIKLTNAPYLLLRVHKYKTSKGIIRDYKYVLSEKATGNEITIEKKDIEKFFENKNWDGKDKSKRLLGGAGALVDGLIESYYAKDDTWHLRVNKNAEVVIDDKKDETKIKDNYTMTEVYATTLITNKGGHKLEKYAFVLENDRTKESDLYTRDQLFNLLMNNDKSGAELYDNFRLKNAMIQYHKSEKGSDSYRVRVSEDKVIWHIDENTNKETKVGKYVCTKVFRVQVPTRNGKLQNQYVEFEMLTLSQDDLKEFENGEYTIDELCSGETFIVTGADLVSMVELPEATEFPFYDSTKLDNLKLKNKKGSTIYDRVAEIEVYKPGKLPASSISKLEPVVVDLDYETWKKSHAEHVAKIEKFIKNKEDKATNTVITWDDVLAQPLTDSEMNAVNIGFDEFWNNRFNGMCRISTLHLNADTSDTPIAFDIIPIDTESKNPNTFVVREARTDGSMKSSSVRKFMLDGEEPQDIDDALGHHWVRFLSCIANAMDRRLVLVLGKQNKKKYAITCVDEVTQKKVIGNKDIYYIPFMWNETFTVTVKAKTSELAENMVYNELNKESNHPNKKLRTRVESSFKVNESLLDTMKKKNVTKVRPVDVIESKEDLNDNIKSEYVNCDIFNTDDGVEIIQKDEERLNTYEVKVEVQMNGYMAIEATSEEEAYKVKVSGILDGNIEFNGTSKYIENSINILSCELIKEYEVDKNEVQTIDNLEESNKAWNDLDTLDVETVELDTSNLNIFGIEEKNELEKEVEEQNIIEPIQKSSMSRYRCKAIYQHDNQPFSEEEIKLQINSALKDVFYQLIDFECINTEKAEINEDFPDDYIFTFEFTILASSGLDMNDLISEVDSGEFLGLVDENGKFIDDEKINNNDLNIDVNEEDEESIQEEVKFKRNSVKFNFFDKARKLAGIPYNIIELYDLIKNINNTDVESYEFISNYFKNYKASQINQIFKVIDENNKYLEHNFLSINYSEDEIQLNNSSKFENVTVLLSLKLFKNKKISDFRVEISNAMNYSCIDFSKYLHRFCDEVTNYLDNIIKDIDVKKDSNEENFELVMNGKQNIVNKLSPDMFIEAPARFIVANDEGFYVETDKDINVPSVKSFADLVCRKTSIQTYDNLYARRENFTCEQVELVNKYSEIVSLLVKEPLNVLLTDDGVSIKYFTRLSVNQTLSNVDVVFTSLFNKLTNQLDVIITTKNMQILRYFGNKWEYFDNLFKETMCQVFEKLNNINEIESEVIELKEKHSDLDWSFLDNFITETIQNLDYSDDNLDIEDTILGAWKDLSDKLVDDKVDDVSFDNEEELEEIEDNPLLNTFDNDAEMSDDDLLNLFNSLGSVDSHKQENNLEMNIPVISDLDLETGLDDLEDLEESEQIKQVEVNELMFLTVFDTMLNILDSKYEDGSIAVIEDEFIITESGIDLKTTKETVDRIKYLLTVEKPVKLSNIYIKLLDSITNKGILETIASEAQIFAVLSNMYEKYGNDMLDKTYREDTTIIGIASSEILAETLKKSGIDSNKFGFLNGVTKK